MDKLVSFLIVFAAVYLIETAIVGSYGWPGVFVKALPATFIAAAIAPKNWPIWSALTSIIGSPSSASRVQPTDSPLTVFGQTIDRPAFLNTVRNFYGRERPTSAYYSAKGGQVGCAGIPPLKASALNERRMFESMLESARFEMMTRGIRFTDHLNHAIWPKIDNEGLVIETIARDDGSTLVILATDIIEPLGRDGWARASQHGIGHIKSAWDDEPLANVRDYWVPGQGKIEFDDPGTGVMPLYQLRLKEVIEQPDQPQHASSDRIRPDRPDAWQ